MSTLDELRKTLEGAGFRVVAGKGQRGTLIAHCKRCRAVWGVGAGANALPLLEHARAHGADGRGA